MTQPRTQSTPFGGMKTSARISTYRDLVAWQHAFKLGILIDQRTASFPEHERFGLTSQLRRGGVSVASNIAEGYGRGSTVDYVRFLKIARGALYELDTQLLFASQLGYLTDNSYEESKSVLDECERVLAGLIRSLERRLKKSSEHSAPRSLMP